MTAMTAMKKRSHAPIFWALFGAGGMLAALFGAALVFITGIAAPLGWAPGAALTHFDDLRSFVRNPLGKAVVFAVVALFAWHAAHRILCSLHDVGVHKGLAAKLVCYGAAFLLSVLALVPLLRIGF
jgi:fumarate reductase subunit D